MTSGISVRTLDPGAADRSGEADAGTSARGRATTTAAWTLVTSSPVKTTGQRRESPRTDLLPAPEPFPRAGRRPAPAGPVLAHYGTTTSDSELNPAALAPAVVPMQARAPRLPRRTPAASSKRK